MTICQTSVAPRVMPRMVHTSNKARVPTNTSRDPATFVTLSKILEDLVFCNSFWNREGGGGGGGGRGGLSWERAWREDIEDAEDMTGVPSLAQDDESGIICTGAEISNVE